MKLVEIRAAEGGDDAKLLVGDMFDIYCRVGGKRGFNLTLVERSPGYVLFRTDGDHFFLRETGGHRWQRIPPTERYGRVQTSTITVAVVDQSSATFEFDERQMEVEYYRASGPGGQNKNKVETACRLKYKDVIVTCASERSKRQNYENALKDLKSRLTERHRSGAHAATNAVRREQIGSGQRGDKIRSYRYKDDVATDHRTGEKARLSNLLKGLWFSDR